eukprot:403340495
MLRLASNQQQIHKIPTSTNKTQQPLSRDHNISISEKPALPPGELELKEDSIDNKYGYYYSIDEPTTYQMGTPTSQKKYSFTQIMRTTGALLKRNKNTINMMKKASTLKTRANSHYQVKITKEQMETINFLCSPALQNSNDANVVNQQIQYQIGKQQEIINQKSVLDMDPSKRCKPLLRRNSKTDLTQQNHEYQSG